MLLATEGKVCGETARGILTPKILIIMLLLHSLCGATKNRSVQNVLTSVGTKKPYSSSCKNYFLSVRKATLGRSFFSVASTIQERWHNYLVGWRVRLGPRNARHNPRGVLLRLPGHADSSRLAGWTYQPHVGILRRSGFGGHLVSADSFRRHSWRGSADSRANRSRFGIGKWR